MSDIIVKADDGTNAVITTAPNVDFVVDGTLAGPAGAQGPTGATGAQGPIGATGPAGATGTAGAGVVTGGTTGQFLKKNSNTDYDTGWQTVDKTTVGLSNVTNNAQYYPGGTDVAITDGGTGVSTLPTGLLKGAGTGPITAATAGTDYQAPITLTTTGSSGPATFSSNTLNIPQYSGGGGGSGVFINVKDAPYSATGNGTTDDTAAIQSAITACNTAGGGTVWFPAGTYKLATNPLKFYSGTTPTITAYSNIRLSGAGSGGTGGTVINQTTTGVDAIKALNDGANGAQSVGCTIENICVQFTGTATNSGNGIYLAQQSASGPAFYQWAIKNVRANNFQGSGKAGFNFESLIVATIEACHAYSCATGFWFNGAVGSEYGSVSTSVSVISCYANSPTVYGYRMSDATYMSFQSCACDIEVNATTGYLVEGCNSIGFYSCGVELDGTHTLTNGFSIAANASTTGSLGVGLYSCYVYQSKSTVEVLITGTSKGVTMTGQQSNSSISGSTALKMDANTSLFETMCNLDSGTATVRTLNASAIDNIIGDSDGYGAASFRTSLSINNAATLTTTAQTGTGSLVMSTSPTITTPTFSTSATLNAGSIITDTTTGLKIGTSTLQKLGFFGVTAVVQQTATTDLGTALSNLGLRAAGTAYPITTSGAAALSGTTSITGALAMGTGGLRSTPAIRTTTTSLSATSATIEFLDATTAAFTTTLPAANASSGQMFFFVRTNATNLPTIAAAGTDKINGAATYTGLSAQYKAVIIVNDAATNWYTLGIA